MICVSSSFTAWIVQLETDLTIDEILSRLEKLEDPIGSLHPDVPAVAKLLYSNLQQAESNSIVLEVADYEQYSRPLRILESQEHLVGKHELGKSFSKGLRVHSVDFMLYMCCVSGHTKNLDSCIEIVDRCSRGESLRSLEVVRQTSLPNAVVVAVFDLYVSMGLGNRSNENGVDKVYYGKA